MYPQSTFRAKIRKIFKKNLSEYDHFYSREILLYIAWACLSSVFTVCEQREISSLGQNRLRTCDLLRRNLDYDASRKHIERRFFFCNRTISVYDNNNRIISMSNIHFFHSIAIHVISPNFGGSSLNFAHFFLENLPTKNFRISL